MDLDKASKAHVDWKVKFRTAIAKQENLDDVTIAKDNCCELGKWLHAEGKAKFGRLTAHKDLLAKHTAFHVEAGQVARLINAARYAEAEHAINAGTGCTTASSAVGVAILRLKKDANL